MNPSTGTFISMDTYEGSIYEPDTLHKYLYANGNPVKYSDPTGNFSAVTMAAGMAINDCVTSAYNVHLMGILSGLSNMAINSILGEQGIELVSDFFEGYQAGVWTAGILYLTAAISVKAFAIVAFGTAAMETIASLVLLISAIVEKDTKEILVYGTLLILSIINLYQSYNIAGEILASGDKGSATIVVECSKSTDFYVTPSGDVVPATGYRYMDSKYAEQTMETMCAPGSYFGFEKFDSASAAQDAFQIAPEWSDCKLRGEFDTLQVIGEMYVPKTYGDQGPGLEPFTCCYPEYGKGGCQQFVYKGKIYFTNVDIIDD